MGEYSKECFRRAYVFRIINELLLFGKSFSVLLFFLLLYHCVFGDLTWVYLFIPIGVFSFVMVVHYFVLSEFLGFKPFMIGMFARKTLGTMDPETLKDMLFCYWGAFSVDILNCVVVLTGVDRNVYPNLRLYFDRNTGANVMTGRIKNVRLDEETDMFTVDIEVL